jgi:hypothetical protein
VVKNANGIASPNVPSGDVTLASGIRTYTYTGLTNNVQYTFSISAVYSRDGVEGPRGTTTKDWSPLEVAEISAVNRFTFDNRYSSSGYNICRYTINKKIKHKLYSISFTHSNSSTLNSAISVDGLAGNQLCYTSIGSHGGLLNNMTYTCTIVAINDFNRSAPVQYTFATGREPQIAIPALLNYKYSESKKLDGSGGSFTTISRAGIYVSSSNRSDGTNVSGAYNVSDRGYNGVLQFKVSNTKFNNGTSNSIIWYELTSTTSSKGLPNFDFISQANTKNISAEYTAGGITYKTNSLVPANNNVSLEYAP